MRLLCHHIFEVRKQSLTLYLMLIYVIKDGQEIIIEVKGFLKMLRSFFPVVLLW